MTILADRNHYLRIIGQVMLLFCISLTDCAIGVQMVSPYNYNYIFIIMNDDDDDDDDDDGKWLLLLWVVTPVFPECFDLPIKLKLGFNIKQE